MQIKRVIGLYWSATGNTKKVVRACANQMALSFVCPMEEYDFTSAVARRKVLRFKEDEFVIIGSPTYAGKLPNKILPDFQTKLLGNNTFAVALVTYGNRAYDNSLAELTDTLNGNGFTVVGAAAFVCRHAFTDKLAYGRPDEKDLMQGRDFCRHIAEHIMYEDLSALTLKVPGDPAAPYYVPKGIDGQPAKFLKAKPKTDPDKCTMCGECVHLCPMESIDSEDPSNVIGICIKCQACIRGCKQDAKYFDDQAYLSHIAMLEANYQQPKENEFFG